MFLATINITMTAICRPKIIERTLKSFTEKMLYVENENIKYNVFVNVDPIGDIDGDPNECVAIVKKYFPGAICHIPKKSGFGRAFKDVWMKSAETPADFTFHLEDDWELKKPVDFGNVIRIMRKYPHLLCLRLNAFHGTKYHSKQWNIFIPWNGVFYQVPNFYRGLLGFSGHPTLIRQEFVKRVAPVLDPSKNPEKQIKGKNKDIKDLFQDPYMFGVYGKQSAGPVVFDIGSKWREKSKWKKAGSKAFFTKYEEKKN